MSMNPPNPKRPKQDLPSTSFVTVESHGSFFQEDPAEEDYFDWALSQQDILREIEDKIRPGGKQDGRGLVREICDSEPVGRLQCSQVTPEAELAALKASIEEKAREEQKRLGELSILRQRLAKSEAEAMRVRSELLQERSAADLKLQAARKEAQRKETSLGDRIKFLEIEKSRALHAAKVAAASPGNGAATQPTGTAFAPRAGTPNRHGRFTRENFLGLNVTANRSNRSNLSVVSPTKEAKEAKDAEVQAGNEDPEFLAQRISLRPALGDGLDFLSTLGAQFSALLEMGNEKGAAALLASNPRNFGAGGKKLRRRT